MQYIIINVKKKDIIKQYNGLVNFIEDIYEL